MHIAIDARELTGRQTGVGRYLSELLTEWHAAGVRRRHTFSLYAHTDPPQVPPGWQDAWHVLPGAGGTRWEQWDLARALGANRPDVLFAPGYTAPLVCPAPVALAVHDVSFFAHPEWFSRREGVRRRLFTAWSARRARVVIAPSIFSASEVVRHVGLDGGRVRLVYLAVREPDAPPAETREPVVLFVGSLFQRRRIDVLIHAFADLARTRPQARLEIVGENRTTPHMDFAATIAARGLDGRARLRHWVDDATLEALYAEATVFAFLSEYEGFGLTPLEAMARGAVPVVLDTPVAREIYGEAAVRVSDTPSLVADVATALAALLDDAEARGRLRAAAGPVLARYRWADAAARTLALLEEAAGA